MYKLSKYHEIEKINDTESLIFSTRTAELMLISNEIYQKMLISDYENIDEQVMYALFSAELLVPVSEDEYETIINNFKDNKDKKQEVLSFTVQPTANCQLGCEYCGQKHEKLRMNESIIENTINYIQNKLNEGYNGLFITWYGAEPLLGLEGIRKISKNLINFCKEKNIDFKAMMITNGLSLKQSIFEEMVELKITKFQITLDGDESTHDLSRYTKKKEKTFQIILENVINAAKSETYDQHNCLILVRCNVHKNNFHTINNLIDIFSENGVANKLSMDFAPVHDWGKNNAKENIGLNPTEFGELEIEWYMKMKESGFIFTKDILPKKKSGTCMVTTKDSELIDAKGRLSYCWETPYTPEFDYQGSEFFHGDIFDNIDRKNRELLPLGDWFANIDNEDYGTTCKKCKFLPVCGGGCPIHWYKEMAMCPSFKYNFKDRMVLQYLLTKEYEAAI